jgi:hypothetical protein
MPDMSEKCLWNLAKEPDRLGYSGGKIDFDVLHFTNSPNASPLIVQSS